MWEIQSSGGEKNTYDLKGRPTDPKNK